MARLPSEQWLIQQVDGIVILFEDGSEREVCRFDPSDGKMTARTLEVIFRSELLSDEDKCFAIFWAGYFYNAAGA
jgi:hypothetical protein